MILRAKWIINRDFQVKENGSINTGGSDEREINLGESILMPGLVNAHCHFDYTHMVDLVPFEGSFSNWVRRITELKREWSDDDYRNSIREGILQSLKFGTTAVANWVCFPQTIPDEKHLRICWFWEQIAFQTGIDRSTWQDWVQKPQKQFHLWSGALAPHAPYTCRSDVIEEAARWSSEQNMPWSIHVAESNEEFEMFWSKKGVLFERLLKLGRDSNDCGNRTPLETVRKAVQAHDAKVLLIHVNQVNEMDLDWLGSVTEKIAVVHCPRSHAFFQHTEFPVTEFMKRKILIALGTDSLASNGDLSMFREMKSFSDKYSQIDPETVVRMATIHGAKALGIEEFWGKWQDWIALPAPPSLPEKSIWETIIRFTGEPHFVMVDGKVEILKPMFL
jgi:aminodeoxyfutalosine deaminase